MVSDRRSQGYGHTLDSMRRQLQEMGRLTTAMTQAIIPQLKITHAEKSLQFYVQGKGFAVDWQHRFEPGFPLFARLTRQGQIIFLTEHAGDCEVGGAVCSAVPDVDEFFRAFWRRGGMCRWWLEERVTQ